MAKQTYTVTQVREVQVEALSPHAAQTLATRAFYGNKTNKADPEGTVLSMVSVKDTKVREGE
jgi:hypothetical protein